MSFKSVVHFPIKVDSIQYREVFLIFSRSSPSVTPVTEEHFYSINATQDHQILHFMTQQYDEAWRRWQNGFFSCAGSSFASKLLYYDVYGSFSLFQLFLSLLGWTWNVHLLCETSTANNKSSHISICSIRSLFTDI